MLVMLFFSLTTLPLPVKADTELPVITNELPSMSYLKKEKRSIASTTESSPMIAPINGILSANSWTDPYLPGDGEWSNPGNVGAPIGDLSLPILFSFLVIYFIYRGATTSRRKSNF